VVSDEINFDLKKPYNWGVDQVVDSWALGQLRHLYTLMLNGHVRDTAEAARGLLGPAIERLEAGQKGSGRDYKEIAVTLWQLLDDIDTAVDAFKPAMTAYVGYIRGKVAKRFALLASDGYRLRDPATGEVIAGPRESPSPSCRRGEHQWSTFGPGGPLGTAVTLCTDCGKLADMMCPALEPGNGHRCIGDAWKLPRGYDSCATGYHLCDGGNGSSGQGGWFTPPHPEATHDMKGRKLVPCQKCSGTGGVRELLSGSDCSTVECDACGGFGKIGEES
jgi:hypothetical protein